MLIKNKFRGIQQKNPTIQHYEPEHQRLGIKPLIGNAALIQPVNIPRNIRVNSGQNEELAWLPKTRAPEEQTVKIKANIPPNVEHVRERTFVNQNYEDGATNNTPIAYDDIPDMPQSVVDNRESEQSVSFSDIEYGEFVLMFEDQILGAGTMDEVSEAIETILLSDETGTISPKSLVVLKRMQIMTGVLIKDV